MAKKAKRAGKKKSKGKARPAPKRKSAGKYGAKPAAKSAAKAKSKAKTAPKKPAKNPIKSLKAIANLQPPGPFELRVKAKVTVDNPGQRARLEPTVPQGINPRILLLDVIVDQLPGIWPQVQTDTDAIYTDPDYDGDFSKVTVLYGNASRSEDVQIVH